MPRTGIHKLVIFTPGSNSARQPFPRIVMTTGVFDVPHVGHPRYLAAAKQMGDILLVGVHSDALVKERKGEGRPVYPFLERVEFLSYFDSVDFIVEMRSQYEVYKIIATVNPHVLVVSETTEDEDNCPTKMHSLFSARSEVVVLGPQSPRHSTDIIKKMEGNK